jgi:hypothetical protein
MLHFLPATAWREFRGVPRSRGLNQTTHRALIEGPTGEHHLCYVKLAPPEFPTPLTEALAWLLAEALDLPRPGFAGLLVLSLDNLRRNMPLDQHWSRYREHLAFFAEAVDGKSPAHTWRWLARLRLQGLYKRPEVARIAAFDEWVENQDRHSGNLLVTRLGKCVPIDNEYVLYSILWVGRAGLPVLHGSLLSEARALLSSRAHNQLILEMAREAQRHDVALASAAPAMQATVMAVMPDPTAAAATWNAVHQFLTPRAHPDWLARRLGVIV